MLSARGAMASTSRSLPTFSSSSSSKAILRSRTLHSTSRAGVPPTNHISGDKAESHPSNPHEEVKMPALITPLRGRQLLEEPSLNKGAAFTPEERRQFGLLHHLPYEYHPLEVQLQRAETQLRQSSDPLAKYSFLRSMQDQNQVLFFALVQKHLKELLPTVYTPTVGSAIKNFSRIFRRPDGVFLSYPHFKEGGAAYIKDAVTEYGKYNSKSIDLIVCTDSEGILGIGDQGVGGVLITLGKSCLYTLGAGVDPNRILNVVLDVGTNNEHLLNDPLYMGWRHSRLSGEEYDSFVDAFVEQTAKSYPDALVHFEDFGTSNANRLLEKFKPKYSVFNDDVQGTGACALATLLSALNVIGGNLKDAKIVLAGAGTAGLGVTRALRDAMMTTEGLSKEEANARFWLVDRYGLIHEGQDSIRPGQGEFARSKAEVESMSPNKDNGQISLLNTVKSVKPTVLIGTSAQPRSFTKEMIQEMSKHCERPIILPISNPTELVEVDPSDAWEWSGEKALIATGSPFPPVKRGDTGKKVRIAELNNALVFPALGLGTILSRSSRLTDSMIVAGVQALAALSPALQDEDAGLLPDLSNVRDVSIKVAAAVMKQAKKEGQARVEVTEKGLEAWIETKMWKPVYRNLKTVDVAKEVV